MEILRVEHLSKIYGKGENVVWPMVESCKKCYKCGVNSMKCCNFTRNFIKCVL